VKFLFYPIEAHYIIRQMFSVFVEYRMSFWELIIPYQTVANGPSSAKFTPLPGSNL